MTGSYNVNLLYYNVFTVGTLNFGNDYNCKFYCMNTLCNLNFELFTNPPHEMN